MPGRLRRAPQTDGDVAVGAFLDHPQLQQLAIPHRERRECSTLRFRERRTVVDRVERGISGEQTGHAQSTASSVLDAPLSQRLAQDVPRDPEQPRQCGPVALGQESASRQPGPCEDLGRQIGGVLADPGSRPGKYLSSVAVIDLLEAVGSARSEELSVRRPFEFPSHNLYLTSPQEMCHDDGAFPRFEVEAAWLGRGR
jgi:hypothetical protein